VQPEARGNGKSARGAKSAPPAARSRARPAADAAPRPPDFLVVGVGASAGGYEAVSHLLRELPQDAPLSVVVVQHLASSPESILSELLASSSRLPVAQATDGLALLPGHVYVIPPDHELSVAAGRLRLGPRPGARGAFMPIDQFFTSLAHYAHSRAVGVVLSGTASDGTLGLKEIKASGGITIAQDPASAKFDGMPRAAIASGAVDLVLAPAAIAAEIVRIARHPVEPPDRDGDARVDAPHPRAAPETWADGDGSAVAGDAADSAMPDGEHLGAVFKLLRSATGVDFTHYKLPTIRRRLQRRMVLQKVTRLSQYVEVLKQNSAEVQALHQDILINVTRFFRDPQTFDALARKVFPRLVAERDRSQPIRIWVPGCSTGEEPYSVAMCLLEFLGDNTANHAIQLFATDISEANVEAARAGIFPESISADVSPSRLRRFFSKTDGHYRITKSVRDLCVFARQDLTRDPPFSRIDLVVCRNVLIYLGPPLQKRLMSVFHYALKPSGHLMLGSAETVGAHADLFAVADKKHRLYIKKGVSASGFESGTGAGRAAVGGVAHPGAFAPRAPARATTGLGGDGSGGASDGRKAAGVHGEASRVILNRYGPPAVVVDADFQIVQFRGQTGAYLEPAPGDASLSLLKMAREGLLFGLRSALHEARNHEGPARKEGLRVRSSGGFHEVDVEVIPLSPTGNERHYLVVFQDAAAERAAPKADGGAGAVDGKPKRRGAAAGRTRGGGDRGDERVRTLESELAASREYMQSVIQDLEATNEELQSANEEILSANEELQSANEELDTAKEELQSTNEELNTLNDELQARNDELSRVNSDLVNLLANVHIAIVMVAADLRVRRFTPTAEKLLNLIPTDVGRPISDIKPNIDCPDIDHLIAEAIDTVTLKERRCQDREGRSYVLRVRPYKNLEDKIDGAVLTVTEVDEARRYQAGVHDRADASDRSARASAERADYAEAVVEVAREPLLVLDADMVVRAANKAFRRKFGLTDDDARGRTVFEVLGADGDGADGDGGDGAGGFGQALRQVLERDTVEDHEVLHDVPGAGRRRYLINARRVSGGVGHPALVLLAIGDATADGGRRGK
jgi:two-component system CheB/CheR fusion protein